MRSTRPKPLHLLCGRPMVLHVLDALAELRRSTAPSWSSATAPSGSPRSCRRRRPTSHLDFVEQHVPARHRRRGHASASPPSPTTTSTTTTATCSSCPATRRCCGRPPSPPSSPTHRETGAACTVLTARLADPTGYGRVRARQATTGCCASSSRPTPPTRSWPSTRSTPRSTASAAACSAPPCAGSSPDNAQGEYYLTDVVGVLHDAGYPVERLVADRPRRGAGRQRPGPAGRGRGRAAAPHQRALAAPRRHHARSRADLHRRHRRARARRHPLPRHDPAGPHRRRRRRRDRPRHPARRLRRRAPAPSSSTTVGRDAEIGERRRRRARSPCSSRAARCRPRTRTGPSTLRPSTERPGADGADEGRSDRDGARHQEAAAPVLGRRPTCRWPRRSPTTSASSSATPNLGRVRQRRDALPVRRVGPRRRRVHHPDATAAATSCRSTTRSWSS